MKLLQIRRTQAQVGDIAHFGGAIFRIKEIRNFALNDDSRLQGPQPVAVNIGEWVSGDIVPCYFGPDLDWNFQGNSNATMWIEPRG